MRRFRLESDGLVAQLLDYGATLMTLQAPDGTNVVLGFDDPQRYLEPHPHIGGVIGRYANRIAHGRFTLDAQGYQLTCNEGSHHLHGGHAGFDRVRWRGEARGDTVELAYVSRDGEEGYPGTLRAKVAYRLAGRRMRVTYEASTDRPTIVNLTHHAYFNLAGGGTIDEHELRVAAQRYVEVDEALIPTGTLADVAGTALDYRQWRRIGSARIDHTFVLQGDVALRDPRSGRSLRIRTTQPGVQVYTGHLSGRRGICLEPQHFPDSPNHPAFPSTVLRPGERYRHETMYALSVSGTALAAGGA
ncbi:MAG TPA: aldose epimerase family protein [Burkholderiales bacterium]|nr:aldose epimerase family protein [Burkholderiales bacterium]